MILIYMPGPVGYKLRQIYYKRKLKSLGKNSLIDVGVLITGAENISIGDYTWIDSFVRLEGVLGEIKIGRRVHIAANCILGGGGGLDLQDYVGLSPGVKIFTNSETPLDGKRMSGPMIPWRYKAFVRKPVTIEKDAFLGTNVVVLPGVRIGEGAVVGANSVVNKDIPPWTIAVGMPARVIGERDKVTVPDI
jgi:galactoside O-acetyltransferase